MVQLLSEDKDVFSSGHHDVGVTKTIHHEIPLAAKMIPIQQARCGLGSEKEKEKEVSRQVHNLLDCDLIEPAHGRHMGAGNFVWITTS